MSQVKIVMHGPGGEERVVDTIFVQGHDKRSVTAAMKKAGLDPDGWRNGWAYTAEINPDITSEKGLTLKEFKKYLAE